MKKIIAGALLLAGLSVSPSAPALAQGQEIMKNYYDNTMVLTLPSGIIRRLHYNADGTYAASDRRGDSKGTYTVTNGRLCSVSKNDKGEDQTNCHPFWAHEVGDVWEDNDEGQILKFTLEKGRP